MKRLGKVSHYAKQGFLILRTDWVPSLNEPVVDKNLTMVGVVKDVFGPVKRPYVAVKPRVKNPGEYVGALLYVDTKRKKTKPNHGKKRRAKGGTGRRPAPRKRG
ncbi:snoRNP component [Thermococcus onnurineus NA1]|uniref:snoRNP component n=1 Tax=Thermococcus onnurineus (strain NA1) TaxID=523850 RepID=B6YXB3_THEON|nr:MULTISPECIES: Gar1/Naf1 family protein [Thermococcus]ACJ16726.1 snoRNP component [Thermococcus onnurineus NA1]NJE43485.1 H/ACA RNA-protein complex protein Gar1 [Thermococcus sp. GR6]NJE46920.1 H/ACA RNA-protein complex protein Gar1 [Thermococcus sp. GR7]NJE78417.1 H/ACA RNA-protein complex protein Gar1 [Thermococcus sp. GR4]NJF23286.1 H/ACA RNA-protein complex protein Gar1 [Thermococcus sp. GR5]